MDTHTRSVSLSARLAVLMGCSPPPRKAHGSPGIMRSVSTSAPGDTRIPGRSPGWGPSAHTCRAGRCSVTELRPGCRGFHSVPLRTVLLLPLGPASSHDWPAPSCSQRSPFVGPADIGFYPPGSDPCCRVHAPFSLGGKVRSVGPGHGALIAGSLRRLSNRGRRGSLPEVPSDPLPRTPVRGTCLESWHIPPVWLGSTGHPPAARLGAEDSLRRYPRMPPPAGIPDWGMWWTPRPYLRCALRAAAPVRRPSRPIGSCMPTLFPCVPSDRARSLGPHQPGLHPLRSPVPGSSWSQGAPSTG
jgi:hypothetical protein